MRGMKQINTNASKIINADVDLFGLPKINEEEQPKEDQKVYLFCVENER